LPAVLCLKWRNNATCCSGACNAVVLEVVANAREAYYRLDPKFVEK
jgi:hypothetical protein